MSYFGGKSGEGVYQQIINLIPPHKVFISAFLGHCAVLRKKIPAQINVGIDLDAGVINHWKSQITHVPTLSLYCVDALTWLDKCKLDSQSFLFCDPPYLHETRKSHSRYQYELTSVEHERLLEKLLILGQQGHQIMICGYWSKLYDATLNGWKTHTYQAMTRSGKMADEWLWMNYDRPSVLHDYRYLGDNFRERERIKRKTIRWCKRLNALPDLERQAIISTINEEHLEKYSYHRSDSGKQ